MRASFVQRLLLTVTLASVAAPAWAQSAVARWPAQEPIGTQPAAPEGHGTTSAGR